MTIRRAALASSVTLTSQGKRPQVAGLCVLAMAASAAAGPSVLSLYREEVFALLSVLCS